MMLYVFLFYMFLFDILMIFLFTYFLISKLVIFLEFEVMNFVSMKFNFLILIDWMSILFISVVLMISMMVIVYSIEYMKGDLNINRFMYMILLFVFSMILMILSPNMISILLGWDGLGLISYCLVIYYQNKYSYNSGLITVLTNRLGDIMILLSIGLLVSNGSWNFMFSKNIDSLIFYLLIMASFTKSSQIPFSSWLPKAMAAPTPVSSLVHSSTLVTAGVYLLIRLNFLLVNKNLISFMMLISVVTMFLSGIGANFEFDLKKIIALSTLSQLGVMIFCLSLKLSKLSFFHLVTHAMFKSMLFMCAGIIIHSLMFNQDIRCISMVTLNMPLVSLVFNCSTLSLCGMPFLSGFFSKDLILEMFLMNLFNKIIFFILFISMGLTVSYSFRLIYYSFIKKSSLVMFLKMDLYSDKMLISMYSLYMMSIIKGLILSWLLFSMKNFIYLTLKFKILIYCFLILGILFGLYISNHFMVPNYLFFCNKFMKFFMNLWFLSMLYGSWIFKIFWFTNSLIYFMDVGWIEYLMNGWLMDFLTLKLKNNYYTKYIFYALILFMLYSMFMINYFK